MATEDQLVLAKLENLSKDIELVKEAQKKQGSSEVEKKEAWYIKWVQILGIPAIVITMLVQVGQFTVETGSAEKTIAETEKIRIEKLKTQADLEKTLVELENMRGSGVAGIRDELDAFLPRIQAALNEIRSLREAERLEVIPRLLMKLIIVWFTLAAVHFIFEVAGSLWSSALGALIAILHQIKFNSRYMNTIKGIVNVLTIILHIAPQMLKWSLLVFIIFAIYQPIAYEAAILLGRQNEFNAMVNEAYEFNIRSAKENMQGILLSSGGNL